MGVSKVVPIRSIGQGPWNFEEVRGVGFKIGSVAVFPDSPTREGENDGLRDGGCVKLS